MDARVGGVAIEGVAVTRVSASNLAAKRVPRVRPASVGACVGVPQLEQMLNFTIYLLILYTCYLAAFKHGPHVQSALDQSNTALLRGVRTCRGCKSRGSSRRRESQPHKESLPPHAATPAAKGPHWKP